MSNPYVLLCGTCTSSTEFTLDTYAHVTTSAQKEAARTMEKVLPAAL